MINDNQELYSFWQHLDELRATVLRALALWVGFFAFFGLTYSWWLPLLTAGAQELFEQDTRPLYQIVNNGPGIVDLMIGQSSLLLNAGQAVALTLNSDRSALHVFSPLESFTVCIKASLWLSAWLSLPFWFFLSLRFVWPAVLTQEKRFISPALLAIFMAWLLSSALTPYLSKALTACLMSWIPISVTPLWGLSAYVDFLFMVLLACAASVLLITLLFIAVAMGWISYERLKNAQKGVILGSFIVGAILTPPDVLSQVALASVLLLAYYLALVFAWLKKPNVYN